ncbi:hypothetical protein ACFS7Z_22535 [Pontibacter toksunensis]|uniref:Activation-induced cytidine deaminase AID domain-containing protein n=1 Tax=Pontibacter toksunensis TaxID=1332631 RepID=A0ABW6BZM1_9BACT
MFNAFLKAPTKRLFNKARPGKKIPTRKDVSPYVASNKRGIPKTRLLAVITLKDRQPAFTIETTVLGKTPHITSGIGGLGGARVAVQSILGKKFVSLPSGGVRGNGGVLFLPQPGSREIRLYAWNVERLSLNRNCSNEQHAEVQFLTWLNKHIQQFPGFVKRIQKIKIYINKSPCNACTEDLCTFIKKHNLERRIFIEWEELYKDKACGSTDVQRLKDCNIKLPKESEIAHETNTLLKRLKLAKQQQHTYLFDQRVHAHNPEAVNRRLERLMNDRKPPASMLSKVFASPHNYARLKRLFQTKIDKGLYSNRKDGGVEVILSFKFNTGWAYGKPVKRLKMIMDRRGGWHYFPVP